MKTLILLLVSLTFSCTHIYTARGVYYRVQKGDTLPAIAQKYRVELQELAEINNIENPEELKVGRAVYIPGVTPSRFPGTIEKETGKPRYVGRRHASAG